ncbi:MAG: hypothetical protein EKK63_12665 [Acinetobacter sp.]|uniref:phage late control D family protein n=1 Tax=Acinetobacter sp. TaxID=472 RepID=UPI000FBFC01E|nr:hypothetical protein [Acinetobacter sp.]RUP38226.1 MAG: hypothetical protein EKK63_12665 [Acinetobacter sp.]
MAESPFYKVTIQESGEDITDMISKLSFEDCLDEDDMVSITVDNADTDFTDRNDIQANNHLIFMYGFIGGSTTGQKIAVIKDSEPDFADTISVTIKARDLGFKLKKDTSNHHWENKTSSEIVKDIAKIFDMQCVVDETTTKHVSKAQGNRSFFQFCKKLAKDEGADEKGGSYEFYVRGGTIYFTKRDFSKPSKRTFTYGDGTSVISFQPSFEQENEATSMSVTASGVDKDSGEAFTVKAEKPETKEVSLGKAPVNFDVDGFKKNTNVVPTKTTSGNVVNSPGNKDAAKKVASGANRTASAVQLKATLKTELEPTIEAGEIITVNGVGKRYSGNWQIRKKTDDVTESPATSTFELIKNGTGKPISKASSNAKTQNTTTGESQGDSSKMNTKKQVKDVNFTVDGKIK